MKLNVGDKVRVKSQQWYLENRDTNTKQISIGKIELPFYFKEDMSNFCDQIVTIKDKIDSTYFTIEEDNNVWTSGCFSALVNLDGTETPILDLIQILGKCEENQVFYCPMIGDVIVDSMYGDFIFLRKPKLPGEETIQKNKYYINNDLILHKDGTFDEDGEIMLFPSKHKRDWNDFNPIPWRAQRYGVYFYVNEIGNVVAKNDYGDDFDENQYKIGNYFRVYESACQSLFYFMKHPAIGHEDTTERHLKY
jgi:hypothetical protein